MEACNKCKYWARMKINEGVCRRFPPIPQVLAMGNQIIQNSTFPSTRGDIWCGDFEVGEPANLMPAEGTGAGPN